MKKVISIAAKLKKKLAPLVDKKLAGCEVIWLEDLDAGARLEAIRRSDIMLAALLTVELSAEEKQLLGGLEMVQTMSAGVDQIDFSALPEGIKLYSNTGGWARGMAEHALAMAMANVIIQEDLYDHDFVDCWTYGFDEFAEADRLPVPMDYLIDSTFSTDFSNFVT